MTDLEPTSDLEDAVFRMYLALERAAAQTPIVAALLERWLVQGGVPAATEDELGDVLSRLIVATQLRYPVIGDLARNVRFQAFDRPVIEAARNTVFSGSRETLQWLGEQPGRR